MKVKLKNVNFKVFMKVQGLKQCKDIKYHTPKFIKCAAHTS